MTKTDGTGLTALNHVVVVRMVLLGSLIRFEREVLRDSNVANLSSLCQEFMMQTQRVRRPVRIEDICYMRCIMSAVIRLVEYAVRDPNGDGLDMLQSIEGGNLPEFSDDQLLVYYTVARNMTLCLSPVMLIELSNNLTEKSRVFRDMAVAATILAAKLGRSD